MKAHALRIAASIVSMSSFETFAQRSFSSAREKRAFGFGLFVLRPHGLRSRKGLAPDMAGGTGCRHRRSRLATQAMVRGKH